MGFSHHSLSKGSRWTGHDRGDRPAVWFPSTDQEKRIYTPRLGAKITHRKAEMDFSGLERVL